MAQARRKLHLAVNEIIVSDETANETDDDGGRRGTDSRHRNSLRQAGKAKGEDGRHADQRNANRVPNR